MCLYVQICEVNIQMRPFCGRNAYLNPKNFIYEFIFVDIWMICNLGNEIQGFAPLQLTLFIVYVEKEM